MAVVVAKKPKATPRRFEELQRCEVCADFFDVHGRKIAVRAPGVLAGQQFFSQAHQKNTEELHDKFYPFFGVDFKGFLCAPLSCKHTIGFVSLHPKIYQKTAKLRLGVEKVIVD